MADIVIWQTPIERLILRELDDGDVVLIRSHELDGPSRSVRIPREAIGTAWSALFGVGLRRAIAAVAQGSIEFQRALAAVRGPIEEDVEPLPEIDQPPLEGC